MKIRASSPGKAILFGEHAVVYGEPAIVTAIDRRTYVEVEDSKNIEIISEDLEVKGIRIRPGKRFETNEDVSFRRASYIFTAIKVLEDEIGKINGARVEIKSDIPIASGLGSSAALVVPLIASLAFHSGHELSKDEIRKLGWRVEEEVQGASSGVDTTIATFGGTILYRRGSYKEIRCKVPLVIGFSGKGSSTKRALEEVRRRMRKNPEIIRGIMRGIGQITRKAVIAIRQNNLEDLGELMNLNQGLLYSLGVSSRELDSMIRCSLEAGAMGAKITGAGMGGCVIAIPNRNEVRVGIRLGGGIPIPVRTGERGLEIESVEDRGKRNNKEEGGERRNKRRSG